MSLLVDRLPLEHWVNPRHPSSPFWSVLVDVAIAEAGAAAPKTNVPPQRWLIDTGFMGEAYAWRSHLVVAGLDPDVDRAPSYVQMTSTLGLALFVPVRRADLWLVSNIPGTAPFRLRLQRGIPFKDVPTPPDPRRHRPLIGMRALHEAGLRLEIDLAQNHFSVWTP